MDNSVHLIINNEDLKYGDENLLALLRRKNIHINADCGGRGACKKCGVRFLKNVPEAKKEDLRAFSEKQLSDGWRLSCKAKVIPGSEIEIITHTDFEIEDNNSTLAEINSKTVDERLVLGIDIGTTTVVMQLCGKESHKLYSSHSFINPQKSFGGDVISRITASNDGKGEELRKLITDKLFIEYELIKKETKTTDKDIDCVAIAANSTMVHLLLGYSCKTLGVHPFTPVNIDYQELDFGEIISGKKNGVKLMILPGISTYVGADITAGLAFLDFDKAEKPLLFIDLGTNGEIALADKDGIIVSSTAAGPAFEGGSIVCGTGSIPGAISNATYKDGTFELKTIADAKPCGICGTGIIEITAELLKNELIDESGRFVNKSDSINIAENVSFYQKDIREIQLAKAAVSAGLLTLMKKKNVKPDDIEKLYIAGGFGTKLNIKKASEIGLIPKGLEDKSEAVGNSSLLGALMLCYKDNKERYIELAKNAKEISLSTDKDFNELYIENMSFDED